MWLGGSTHTTHSTVININDDMLAWYLSILWGAQYEQYNNNNGFTATERKGAITFLRSSLILYLAVNMEGLRLFPEQRPPKMDEEDTPQDTLEDMLMWLQLREFLESIFFRLLVPFLG